MGWGAASRALCAPPPTPFPVRAPQSSHLPGREVSLPRGSSSATSQNTSSSRPSWPPNSGSWATCHCDLCHDAPTGLETPRVISELLVLTQGLTLGAGMQGGSRRNEGNPGSHWPLLASCSFSPLLTAPQVWPLCPGRTPAPPAPALPSIMVFSPGQGGGARTSWSCRSGTRTLGMRSMATHSGARRSIPVRPQGGTHHPQACPLHGAPIGATLLPQGIQALVWNAGTEERACISGALDVGWRRGPVGPWQEPRAWVGPQSWDWQVPSSPRPLTDITCGQQPKGPAENWSPEDIHAPN